MTSIKAIASGSDIIKSISSKYAYANVANYEPTSFGLEDSIPTIDYSLLTSSNPDQRSKAVRELGKACEEWGFFLLVNHGVPDTLMEKMMKATDEFFALTEEEKHEFEGKGLLDPIRCSTSFPGAEKGSYLPWRDYLKVIANPQFYFPNKPIGFSEVAQEYATRTRMVTRELLKGVSECLGLEESYMNQELNLDSGLQLLVMNYYPPCPMPETAIGLPPHTDHGLLTLLYQNGVGGLQVQHDGKWVHVNDMQNAFLVNVGDHLEIFTNGKYKSIKHRATLNDKVTRITLVTPHGPSLDTVVKPSSKFVDDHGHPPAYRPMEYQEYIESQPKTVIDGITSLDRVRIPV